MAFVLFKDSFTDYLQDTFANATLQTQFQYRYQTTPNNGFASINSGGRNGACVSMSRGSGAGFSKTLAHSAEWVVGFAYRIDGTGAGGTADGFYAISNNNVPLFSMAQASDGTLVMYAGANVIAVTDRALITGRWYYLEMHVTFSGATISTTAELRINGHVEKSGTVSTGVLASSLLSLTADANVHGFVGLNGVGGGCSFDDLYIKNESGYFDDERVVALFPNGDGATLNWTPNSGTTHYDRVSTHPVDLTKWLETAVVNNIDLWDFEDCPAFSGKINAVNIRVLARKDDEGTKSFKIVAASNTGTVYALSDEFFVSDVTPEYYEWSLKLDPNTGLAWTQAGFNAMQWGVKLIS